MKTKLIIAVLAILLWSCEKIGDSEILRFYGDAYEDIGYSVAKTSGGYLIAGQYTRIYRDSTGVRIDSSEKKMIVIRTDINGLEIRRNVLNEESASSGAKIIAMDDGTAIVVGHVVDPVSLEKDIYVVKLAPEGEGYTEKIFRWEGNQYANDVIKTEGGYLILGTTDVARGYTGDTGNKKGNKDILLLSISESLDSITSNQTGYPGNDEGIVLKEGHGGKFIVVGTTDVNSSTGGNDIFIMSDNQDLNSTAIKPIAGPDDESASDFEVVADGYLIAGTAVKSGLSRGFAWKVPQDISATASGHDIFIDAAPHKSFTITSICKFRTNSFLMAGQYGSGSTGDMLIFATDSKGYFTEGEAKVAGGTGSQAAYDVIADGEDVIAVGKNSYENNSLITLMKFRF